MRGPPTANINGTSNNQLPTQSTVVPLIQFRTSIRNREHLYLDTWTHRSNHGYLIHRTHSTKIMNETNEISKPRLTHCLKSIKSMGKLRSELRTCSHRDKVRGKGSDLIGQFSETSKIHGQSFNSPQQAQYQPFASMSSSSSSSSRRKRSQERYIYFCCLNLISHQEQILWVKIPPVTLGHLNGLDLILLINQ